MTGGEHEEQVQRGHEFQDDFLLGLEWYQTIMLTTLCLRLFTFPFVVMAQKNVAKMSKVAPGMRVLQDKITEARLVDGCRYFEAFGLSVQCVH